jgi:hypothetical protein
MTTTTGKGRRRASAPLLAIVLSVCAASVHGSLQTLGECLEGSDFIANAALSRDNGMTRTAFLGRLEEDMMMIHAFPAELRWFVKDDDDERFLHAAAESVFDVPASPEVHRAEFLRACFARLNV